jgi:hypothetical protein
MDGIGNRTVDGIHEMYAWNRQGYFTVCVDSTVLHGHV